MVVLKYPEVEVDAAIVLLAVWVMFASSDCEVVVEVVLGNIGVVLLKAPVVVDVSEAVVLEGTEIVVLKKPDVVVLVPLDVVDGDETSVVLVMFIVIDDVVLKGTAIVVLKKPDVILFEAPDVTIEEGLVVVMVVFMSIDVVVLKYPVLVMLEAPEVVVLATLVVVEFVLVLAVLIAETVVVVELAILTAAWEPGRDTSWYSWPYINVHIPVASAKERAVQRGLTVHKFMHAGKSTVIVSLLCARLSTGELVETIAKPQ